MAQADFEQQVFDVLATEPVRGQGLGAWTHSPPVNSWEHVTWERLMAKQRKEERIRVTQAASPVSITRAEAAWLINA